MGDRTTVVNYGDDTIRKQFTGYERDEETDLDFAQARYLAKNLGRFNSPDYFRNDTKPDDPQSWNLYTYCRNNPLFFVDPDGKRARVTYTTNLDEQTGEITISASFAIYAKKGKYSVKELEKQKNLLLTQIRSTFKEGFVKDGITYTVKTNISATISSSKAEAEASGSDNIVGLVKAADLGPGSNGGTAVGSTYNLGGEQDYITVATASNIEGNNTYAHEFGHGLGTNPSHLAGGPRLMAEVAPAATYLAYEDFDLIFGSRSRNHVAKHTAFAGRSAPRPAMFRFSDLYNTYSTTVVQRARYNAKTDPY